MGFREIKREISRAMGLEREREILRVKVLKIQIETTILGF